MGDPTGPGDARSTALIHHGYVPPAGFGAISPGVFKASTVLFEDVAALRSHNWLDKTGYSYGLHGTPTSFTLEARLATLEGGTHALLAPSGLAAVALVNQAILSAGDTVLLPTNVYFPNRNLAAHELARWGIAHRFYDPMRAESLQAALGADVALVWIEAPGSVTLEFPDVRALVRASRAGRRARSWRSTTPGAQGWRSTRSTSTQPRPTSPAPTSRSTR